MWERPADNHRYLILGNLPIGAESATRVTLKPPLLAGVDDVSLLRTGLRHIGKPTPRPVLGAERGETAAVKHAAANHSNHHRSRLCLPMMRIIPIFYEADDSESLLDHSVHDRSGVADPGQAAGLAGGNLTAGHGSLRERSSEGLIHPRNDRHRRQPQSPVRAGHQLPNVGVDDGLTVWNPREIGP